MAVVNARFAKPLDEALLEREFTRQPHVFTLEDHVVAGGFGSAVLEQANALLLDSRKCHILAIEDHYVDLGQRVEALQIAGLDVPSLVAKIERQMAEKKRTHPKPTGILAEPVQLQ